MEVELRPVSEIQPYENNPRINDAAVEAVAESIKQFGWRQPIVVDPNGIIVVGHTRWKAAKRLELCKVPVHVAKDLSPEQLRAYRIADNKTAELSGWEFDLLTQELSELELTDIDLESLGFTGDEIGELLGRTPQDGLSDPDAVPEPPDDPVTQTGDLYVLGNHRLLCGDSSSTVDVDRLLDGASIHLVNTDPPYNVKVEPRSNNAIAAGNSSFTKQSVNLKNQQYDVSRMKQKSRKRGTGNVAKIKTTKMRAKDRPLENDFVTDEEFDRLLESWFGNIARVLDPGRSFYIWGGYANCANYPPVLQRHDLYFSQSIIWDKMHPVLTRKDFMGAHEWCFYGWKKTAGHKFFGPNNATDLWHVKKVNPQSMVHLTEKPVELAVKAIQYSSRSGEHVLDLFGGSGSTLIAAEQTDRHAFLMEIDPAYCDVIVQRWEEFTGKKAERITGDGEAGKKASIKDGVAETVDKNNLS